ncbi:MAG: hypothetical protein V4651_01555, partial [Bacteroidota bacterium]
ANQTIRGISFGTTTGTGTADFYHNSVSINNPGLNITSAAFWKGEAGLVTARNNIFSNTSPAQTGVAKHFAAYIAATPFVASNNIYWAPNANGFVGFSTADKSNLALFASINSAAAPTDGNDQGSANANPNFISATDLNFAAATPAVSSGTPITTPFSINADILGNVRSTTAPSVGAYETTQPLFDSAAPVITNIIVNSGTTPSIYATIKDNGVPASAGNVQLWYRSGSTGTFTALTPDSIPVGTMNGTYKWGASVNSLPVANYQFYIAARDAVGVRYNISVNPIQASTFTGFSATDPVTYLNNPDPSVTTRSFTKRVILPAGTYNVGATSAPYFKLTDVANALNVAEITGNVIFELQADYDGTTGETFPITFNQLSTVGGNWTVTIRLGATVTARETSGYPASAVPLISLNGADRITFDGRQGGTGSNIEWTIRSKRTAASTNSPCVQLINGAQRNMLKYLKLESGSTTAANGTIQISTTNTSEGNSLNIIQNCEIRDRSDSVGVPATAIYSAGTAATPNDSNEILNNLIYNWSATGVHSTATGNGNGWKIANNSFYMTTATTTAQTSIRFLNASLGNIIENNTIGGTLPLAAGTAWTNSGNIAWRGIVASTSQTDSSFIRNNIVTNIALTGTGAGTYGGIELTGGLNSVNGNTIGNATIANSIQSSQLGTQLSLWSNGTGNIPVIYNNTVANINSTGNTNAVGHNGIRITSSSATNPLVIRNNTIFGLASANPTVSISTAAVVGILSLSASTLQTVSNNTVYDLSCTGGPANALTTAIGINIDDAAAGGTMNANRVYNIKNTSTNILAKVLGINFVNGATWTVSNNMVALGSDITNDVFIAGINDSLLGTLNIYNNSVLISGNNASAVDTTYGYRRYRASTATLRNNIFNNIRTSSSANYAIGVITASPGTNWKTNYNDLNTSNASQLGLWNAASLDFSTWKTTTLHDTSSINTAASFVSGTDLHLAAPTIGDLTFAGRPLSGLTTDYDGQTRDLFKPYMGADEIPSSPLPVTLVNFSASKNQSDVIVSWITASEINASHFEIERSIDGKDFTNITTVKATGISNT